MPQRHQITKFHKGFKTLHFFFVFSLILRDFMAKITLPLSSAHPDSELLILMK